MNAEGGSDWVPFWNVFKTSSKRYPKNISDADGQQLIPDSQKLPFLNEEKKASCQALPGNMTVEAAVVLPLFLFAAVNLLSMILMFQEFSVQEGKLHQTGRTLSLLAYGQEETGEDDIRLVKVSRAEAVFPLASYRSGYIVNGCVMHKWIGYDPGDADGMENGGKEEMVYITASGEAYHLRRGCIYLNPSVSLVARAEAQNCRNSEGKVYTACSICGGDSDIVYIAQSGERYHSTAGCSGLKRTVECVSLPEALARGRHACPGCGS